MNFLSVLLVILLACQASSCFATDLPASSKPDFQKLRNQRLQLISDMDGIKAEKLKINDETGKIPPLPTLESYIKEDEDAIENLKSRLDNEKNKKVSNPDIILKLQNDLRNEESRLNRDKQALAAIKDAEKQIDNLQAALKIKEKELFEIEIQISDALSRDVVAQNFKSQISLYFALLVGFMILCFFGVAFYDQSVRITIFSGQAGIQFVTLFSLIIAIILFGITGILEDKELAALLGGLSGYILGRYNQTEGSTRP